MMSKRRTLLAGILLPAFVLFLLPASVSAQGATDITVNGSTNGYGSILVTWSLADSLSADELATIEGFRVRHEALASGGTFGVNDVISDQLAKNARTYELDGLKHSQNYVINVGFVLKDVDTPTWANAVDNVLTLEAPVPDEVDNVMLMPGDGMLMVEWDEGDGNGLDISGYGVQISTKKASGYTAHYFEGTGTSTTISGLTNGTMYLRAGAGGNRRGSSEGSFL